MKRCSKCGVERPLLLFYRQAGVGDGYRSQCKMCEAARSREWYQQNKERVVARVERWRDENREQYLAYQREYNSAEARKRRDREGHLRRKFGITLDDYERMLAEQDGGCAICQRPPAEGKSLHVDHDPETGRVRGLLCFKHNNALGDFEDDPGLLYLAVDYLTADPALYDAIRQRMLAMKAAVSA